MSSSIWFVTNCGGSPKASRHETISDEIETICTRPRHETWDLKFWSRDQDHVWRPNISDNYETPDIRIVPLNVQQKLVLKFLRGPASWLPSVGYISELTIGWIADVLHSPELYIGSAKWGKFMCGFSIQYMFAEWIVSRTLQPHRVIITPVQLG